MPLVSLVIQPIDISICILQGILGLKLQVMPRNKLQPYHIKTNGYGAIS